MIRPATVSALLATLLLVACDDRPKDKPGTTKSAAASAKPAPTPTETKPKTMPELLVDPDGPYLGGRRIDLAAANGKDKLTEVIKDLPIDGKAVSLQVEKKAKTPHVAAVVYALGVAGAPKVILKTNGRDDLPKEVVVTPETKISGSVPACAVAASVLKDLSTAVWPQKGGLGKRQRKGLAGPDLSHTAETLEKDLAACDSSVAFFSSDDEVQWEDAFNIAGTIVISDKKKRIDTLVLPRETPVAGRALSLSK